MGVIIGGSCLGGIYSWQLSGEGSKSLGGNSPGENFIGVSVWGAVVQREIIQG